MASAASSGLSLVGRALGPARLDLLTETLALLRSIAASTETLTQTVDELAAIAARVDSLDREVALMRTSVDEILAEVRSLRVPRRRGRGAVGPGA